MYIYIYVYRDIMCMYIYIYIHKCICLFSCSFIYEGAHGAGHLRAMRRGVIVITIIISITIMILI